MATERDASTESVLVSGLTRLSELRYTNAEVCRRAGVDRDVGDQLWRAMGFPDVPDGTVAFGDDDARALRLATEGLDTLPDDSRQEAVTLLLQEARILSAHLATLAELQLDLLEALTDRGLRHHLLADAVQHGLADSELGWLILYDLRRQLDAALRRRATTHPADAGRPVMTIGFVDLVGFAELTERVDADELTLILTRFESAASDVIAESGG